MSGSHDTPPPKTIPLRVPPDTGDHGPILVVVEGLEPGRRFALGPTSTTIGRGPDNDVVLPSPAVSNNHLRIDVRDGQFWIEDLRSTNGVRVNGNALRAEEPRVLANGDAIRVSDHLLLFHHGKAQRASFGSPIEIDEAEVARQVAELMREIEKPR